jgi:hypothetical protein
VASGGPPPSTQTVQAAYSGNAANLPGIGTGNLTVNEPSADLAIVQQPRPTDDGIQFAITVTNKGPEPATNIIVKDSLKAAGIQRVQADSKPPSVCRSAVVPAGYNAARRCTQGSLAVGATWTVVIHVIGGPSGGSIISRASVSGATPADPIAGNDVITTQAVYGPVADLAVDLKAGPGPGNGEAVVVSTVTNQGPNTARSLVVDIDLTTPGGKTPPAPLPDSGSCTTGTPPSGYAIKFLCTLATLGANAAWRVRIVVVGTNGHQFSAMSTIAATGSYDPNTLNDRTSVGAQVAPQMPIAAPGTTWLVVGGAQSTGFAHRVLQSKFGQNQITVTIPVEPTTPAASSPAVSGISLVFAEPTSQLTGQTYLVYQFVGGWFSQLTFNGTTETLTITYTSITHTTCTGSSDPAACYTPAVALGVSSPTLVPHGIAQTLTVTAFDVIGHRVPGFTGTVQFSSTDPGASLPSAYTFRPADHGAHTFSGLTLSTPGWQVVVAAIGPANYPEEGLAIVVV